MAKCTIEKVRQQSASKNGPSLQKDCVPESIVKQQCEAEISFSNQHFRTMDGKCNNKERPLKGSKGDKLSRLLPPEYEKYKIKTFDHVPTKKGK